MNDNKDVNVKCQQTMRCIFCYNNPILFCNPKTQARKSRIIYNTTNGITTLKKHVNANDFITANMFEEEINNLVRGKVEKQLAKKKSNTSNNAIVNFFVTKEPFQKDHM